LMGNLFIRVRRLGVRRIRVFNIALLGKWCWRLLVDRDSLWFRVLSARYGVEWGCVREGGREASVWWSDISFCNRRNGSKVMLVSLWEMAKILSFEWMFG